MTTQIYKEGFKINESFVLTSFEGAYGDNKDYWVEALGGLDRSIHNWTLRWSNMQADVFNTDDIDE